jgi:hypothetical protein
MKFFKQITLTLLVLVSLFSCTKKELDITMNIVEDGTVKIRLLDPSENPLADVKVELGDYNGYPLAEGKTDADGWFIANNLLSGNYMLVAQDVEVQAKKYNVVQMVQVISGKEKEYMLYPHEYSGTAIISVMNRWQNTIIPDIGVAIFSSEDLGPSMDYNKILSIAIDSARTDEFGEVVFTDLPLGSYGGMVYYDSVFYTLDNYSFSINSKGSERRVVLFFDL